MIVAQKGLALCPHHLECVECFKYLGLLPSSNLFWTAHILSLYAVRWGSCWDCCTESSTNIFLLQLYISLHGMSTLVCQPSMEPLPAERYKQDVQKFALGMCSKCWYQAYSQLLQLFCPNTDCTSTFVLCSKLYMDYLNFFLAFWALMAEFQA